MKFELAAMAAVLSWGLVTQDASAGTLASIPAKAAGFVAGAVIGTPICLVRKFKEEEVAGVRGMIGESKNPLLVIPAGVFWLPCSTLYSTMESPVYAVRNSWKSDKPFSKEQFSLD